MTAAVWGEAVKLAASTVGRIGSLALVLGISALSGAMLIAARSGDPQVLAKLGPVASGDWEGFLLGAAQVTGAGGLLGFGVVVSWMFGREFGDGTIAGLFALPVRRTTIALAKLLVYGAWALIISVLLALLIATVGVLGGLGGLTADSVTALARQVGLGVMTAAIAVPAAWAASLGRSVLAGVSTSIGLVVIAQVSVLAGAGGWMPLSAPALWAISSGAQVTAVQLLLVVPTVGLATLAISLAWSRLQLDR